MIGSGQEAGRSQGPPRAAARIPWGWLGPVLVTVFAGFLRFDRLGSPHAIVFDETYYAKDAYGLLRFGFEHATRNYPKGIADRLFLAGRPGGMWADGGSFVAHPPFGKWMIALGEAVFGVTPFGWRCTAALCGTLSVLILCRLARRMTGSTLLGCAAGFLMALDGLHLVLSRTALLDIFLMFWVLAGFACLVADRDQGRAALAGTTEASGPGPWLFHPWRIAAGACLGLAAGVKWSAVPYLAAFVVMVFAWDLGARRALGFRSPLVGAALRDGTVSFLSLGALPVAVYTATWSGWLFTGGGWGRREPAANPLLRPFEGLPGLWEHHVQIWRFHNRLTVGHDYQSWPWDWPVLRRPVAFFYTRDATGCGAARCSREILGIGTPAIWWASMAALLVMVFLYLTTRDWRAGAILCAYAAGWLPWFPPAFADRTMFLFYALPLVPFMCLALVMTLGTIIGPARGAPRPRAIGAAVAGAFVLLVLLDFWYLHPILTGGTLPYDSWHARMWMRSWI
ncbi:dolichyl-phosphate-mannose--protein mannosyltransferase [Actinocorallia longicatena]